MKPFLSLILTVFIFCCGSCRIVYSQATFPHENSLTSVDGYTGDKVLGNPENGVKALEHLYQIIQKYRANHQGALPNAHGGNLKVDLYNNPHRYGFQSMEQAQAAIENLDGRFNPFSSTWHNPKLKTTPAMRFLRLNGVLSEIPKEVGTSDVWAINRNYFYENSPNLNVGREKANPVGFYLILRDDGKIARVPYDEVFFAYSFKNKISPDITLSPAFPNEPGVPYNCLSYQERAEALLPGSLPPIGTRVPEGQLLPLPDNGGFESLVQMSRLLNQPLERSDIWKSFDPTQGEFTLADVQAGADKLNLALESRKLALDDLAKLNAPAIFLTSDDKRIVVLSNLDDKEAIVVDRGLTRIVSRELLTRRYSGEVLLAKTIQGEAGKVLCDDAVRVLNVANTADEIAQSVPLRNGGTQPLALQIERPIPGATQAELSSDTIAPGQTATLNLKLKWRDMLKNPTQNVFVFLKTNDPKRPRLQLGFQLKTNAATIVDTTAATAALPSAEADPTVVIGRAMPTVQVGQPSVDFTATDMNGKVWKLSELKAKRICC